LFLVTWILARQLLSSKSIMTKTIAALILGLGLTVAACGEPAIAKTRTSGSVGVGLSIPAVHGMDVAEGAPAGGVRNASFSGRSAAETKLRFSLIDTNGASALSVRRTVLSAAEPGFVRTGNGGKHEPAATAETTSFARRGAFGWRRLEDRVSAPKAARVSSGQPEEARAVVYELWHF
jgi:hypothetical protein